MTVSLFSRFSWRRGRRAAAAIGAASLGLVALAACDKPTPLATVTVGSSSVHAEASSGCYGDGKTLPKSKIQQCLNAKPTQSITVHAGEQVRIGVDPAIAHSGWVLVAAAPVMNEASKQTYRTFDGDTLFEQQDQSTGQTVGLSKSVTATIVELGDGSNVKGMWHFKLNRDS